LGAAFGGSAYYRAETAAITEAKHEDLAAIAELKVGQIVGWRRDALTDARRPVKGPYFANGVVRWLHDSSDSGVEQKLLERLRFELEEDRYSDVFLCDPTGRVLLSARPRHGELDDIARQTVDAAMATGDAVLGDLHRTGEGIAIDVAAPLLDATGKPIAAFVLRTNAETYLYPLISSWPTSSRTAETLLVRRDGTDAIFLNELRHARGTALARREPLAHLERPAVAAVLGARGRFDGLDYRGVRVLADLRPVPDSPWFLVAKVDAAEFLAEAQYRALVTVFAVAILVVLVAGATAFGYRHQLDVQRRRDAELQAARLRLLELATTDVAMDQLLRTTLDEAGRLTGSPLGFFHFVAANQRTTTPWAGSTQSQDELSQEVGKEGCHQDEAGIWADCLRQRRPIVHNDCGAAPNHGASLDRTAVIRRELVVPIFRGKLVVALLGVANKAFPYTGEDVKRVMDLADLAWDVVARRQAESAKVDLEEQLRLGQRMESIGRLAGGVAHDFNNLLTVIRSCSDFLLADLPVGDPRRTDVEEIHRAGERAAALTRQLLAFGRKQVLEVETFDLNEVVRSTGSMLQRLVGEQVNVATTLAGQPVWVAADRRQMEQVIVNLVVNSRDAMPQGGVVSVETAEVELDEHYASFHVDAKPGPHAMLSVSDTGCGLDDTTRARIFEPFFTTKPSGSGTGLGLATVYGIVKQSGGNVRVYSEVGKGTTFKVYFPLATEPAGRPPDSPRLCTRGTETILVVEDEPAVREQVRRTLARAGYQVLTAASASEALQLDGEQWKSVELVITDVIMPGMGGPDLVARLAEGAYRGPVLYASGYTEVAIVQKGVLAPGVQFISKPFDGAALAQKVRDVIDQSKGGGPRR
jgi:signal transduction histidine kinase/CheY-like chemotaxis protein